MSAMRVPNEHGGELDALYGDARGSVLRVAAGIAGRDEGEDILHDAFIAYMHRHHGIIQPHAWLSRVARNRALNATRHPTHPLTQDLIDEASSDQNETSDVIAICLPRLRPRTQLAIQLRFFQEADYNEIAAKLGTSIA